MGICPHNIQRILIKTSIMEPRKFEIPRSPKKIRGFAHPIFVIFPGPCRLFIYRGQTLNYEPMDR